MGSLDDLYRDLISPPQEVETSSGRRNITLRLSKDAHEKLDHIRALDSKSKTVMAEELLIAAIEDVHQRMVSDARLDGWWADRAEELARLQEEAEHQAIYEAEMDAREAAGVA